MAHNFNTIEGTEVFNVNDPVQGSHALTLDDFKGFIGDKFHSHIVGTSAYDPLLPLSGWTAPSNPIEGNTATVQFTDGTIGNYTFDGTAWVQYFNTPTYKLKSCSGADLAKDTKVHQVQNLARQTGLGVVKLDGVDCLGHNDIYYDSSINSYAFSSSTGSVATGNNSRSLGVNSIASNTNSFALGVNSVSSGIGAYSIGDSNNSSNTYSFALGVNNISSGLFSHVYGLSSQATAYNAFCLGNFSSVTGANSSNLARESTVSGEDSFNSGSISNVSGNQSSNFARSGNISGEASLNFGVNGIVSGNRGINFAFNSSVTSNYGVNFTAGSIQNIYKSFRLGGEGILFTGQSATLRIPTDFAFVIDNGEEVLGVPKNSASFTHLKNGFTQINTGNQYPKTQSQVTPLAALHIETRDFAGNASSGALLAPMTLAERNTIPAANLQNGLEIYCTDGVANDTTIGVKQVYQASTGLWKNLW